MARDANSVAARNEPTLPADSTPELVILLNDRGDAIGSANKSEIHTTDTPLHLAFSCYLLNEKNELLITRRALSKVTWPGVWTNSFCGHPAPGETLTAAVERRAAQELGVRVNNIIERIDNFRYRAVDASGIVENEICTVFTAVIESELNPNRHEVAEWAWVNPQDLQQTAQLTPSVLSPWAVSQLELLNFSPTSDPHMNQLGLG